MSKIQRYTSLLKKEDHEYMKYDDAGWWMRHRDHVEVMDKLKAENLELIKANADVANINGDLNLKIIELQEFAIWMTGCGYDFADLPYFIKMRDKLLKETNEQGNEEEVKGTL